MSDSAAFPPAPRDWTPEQWNTFDCARAPTFACPYCRKRGVRVTLTADWDADDYRAWHIFAWECPRCERAWNLRQDRLAPDWQDRVN